MEQDKITLLGKQGFKVKSGIEDPDGNLYGYAVHTDEGIGFAYYKDGEYKQACTKTSLEVCGTDLTDDVSPGKVIIAQNGNIHLEAKNGDIVIKAKNIRFVAEDGSGEITLSSGKHFYVNAPICKIDGTDTTILGSKNVSVTGLSVESTGHISNCSSSSNEILQGSLVGQISNGLKNIKKFFEDCFG